MPAKPVWIRRVAEIVAALEVLPSAEVDRATIESVLGVRRRRAIQLMNGLPGRTVGASALVSRAALIDRLRSIAETGEYEAEAERRNHFASVVDEWRRERIENPQVLVEAPTRIVNTDIESLPSGVTIEPGRITVEFARAQEALEKLLALAMALGNQYDAFEQLAEPAVEKR